MDENQPKLTISVPEAGRIYYGIGKNASYLAAHRGEIPTIQIGKLLRVPINAMEKRLENADKPSPLKIITGVPE